MRLKTKEYKEIMQKKGLSTDQICKSTGLSEFSFHWILNNSGFASDGTLKALAIAADAKLEEIIRPNPSDNIENGIEFIKDAETAVAQFSQGRFKTRLKRLAAKHPEECQILAENPDGTLLAHIPVEWVKISPPAARSELQRELSRKRMLAFHEKHTSVAHEKG